MTANRNSAGEPVVPPDDYRECERRLGPQAARRFYRIARSEGNRQLVAIDETIDRLRGMLGEFLDAHPDGCDCRFCDDSARARGCIREDVAGVKWTLDVASGLIGSVTSTPRDVDDLGRMVDDAARGAADDAGAADAPTVITR